MERSKFLEEVSYSLFKSILDQNILEVPTSVSLYNDRSKFRERKVGLYGFVKYTSVIFGIYLDWSPRCYGSEKELKDLDDFAAKTEKYLLKVLTESDRDSTFDRQSKLHPTISVVEDYKNMVKIPEADFLERYEDLMVSTLLLKIKEHKIKCNHSSISFFYDEYVHRNYRRGYYGWIDFPEDEIDCVAAALDWKLSRYNSGGAIGMVYDLKDKTKLAMENRSYKYKNTEELDLAKQEFETWYV